MTQHKDDLSNVNFDLDKIGSEFHGFVRKRKVPNALAIMSQDRVNSMVEDLADEINFYYAQEVRKRQRTHWVAHTILHLKWLSTNCVE